MSESTRRKRMGLPPRTVKVTPDMVASAREKVCECGCRYFIPVFRISIISALVSPNGQELRNLTQVMACMECRTVVE